MTIIKEYNELFQDLKIYDQEHLLKFWDELKEEQRELLISDISEINFEKVLKDAKECKNQAALQKIEKLDKILEPLSPEICGNWENSTEEELNNYNNSGLEVISRGEYASILMAGGAGTRLGVNYPKGMYNVNLPSNKSLFQLQSERLLKLQQLAADKFGSCKPITWYIMTSECTRDRTKEFFMKNNYFGLLKDQLVFFEQFTLPVIGLDGRILLESKCRIAKSPDGNGGLYRALYNYKLLDDMDARSIKYVFVYGVDNILVKIADPLMLGFCLSKQVECVNKVVEKTLANESVGVVGLVKGRFQVVEYSEINSETASTTDPNEPNKLLYRHANICTHLFHRDFLHRVCQPEITDLLTQHIALKSVPCINLKTGIVEKPASINAIKMEKFVFDVFTEAKSFAVWQVDRDREFSPLKNAPGNSSGSPETCRESLLKYQKTLLCEEASASTDTMTTSKLNRLLENFTIELAPLVTYSGENLDKIVQMLLTIDVNQLDQSQKAIIVDKESLNSPAILRIL